MTGIEPLTGRGWLSHQDEARHWRECGIAPELQDLEAITGQPAGDNTKS